MLVWVFSTSYIEEYPVWFEKCPICLAKCPTWREIGVFSPGYNWRCFHRISWVALHRSRCSLPLIFKTTATWDEPWKSNSSDFSSLSRLWSRRLHRPSIACLTVLANWTASTNLRYSPHIRVVAVHWSRRNLEICLDCAQIESVIDAEETKETALLTDCTTNSREICKCSSLHLKTLMKELHLSHWQRWNSWPAIGNITIKTKFIFCGFFVIGAFLSKIVHYRVPKLHYPLITNASSSPPGGTTQERQTELFPDISMRILPVSADEGSDAKVSSKWQQFRP